MTYYIALHSIRFTSSFGEFNVNRTQYVSHVYLCLCKLQKEEDKKKVSPTGHIINGE